MNKILLGWDDIAYASNKVAEGIKKSAFAPDTIIAIGRGGWVPAINIANALDIKVIYNYSVSSYNDNNVKDGNFHIFQKPDTDLLINANVLVVDDISDTGDTLNYITHHLIADGVKHKTATLYEKVHTKFIPDYVYLGYNSDTWIVFPWEKNQD